MFGATFLAVRLGIAQLPNGVSWRQLHGASLLAGIGFTDSLFIAGLAYGDGTPEDLEARLAILTASLVCAVAGLALLRRPAAAATAGDSTG